MPRTEGRRRCASKLQGFSKNSSLESGAGKSDERLRELILYIADRSQTDPRFGATKLNKLVFFADFQSYAERGKPITGCQYMRLPNGPVPRHLIPIRDRLVEEGELSHDRKWRIAGGDKEAIPYQAAFISNEPITAYEIARTGELAERYGWAQG